MKQDQQKYWENVEYELRRGPFHPVIQHYTKPKVELIANILNLPNSSSLLECGCGNGFYTVHFAEKFDVTGLDNSEKMLKHNPHEKVVKGDIENLQFEDSTFDVVGSINVLHHIENPLKAVGEVARVSRKYTVFIEPNRNNPLFFINHIVRKVERGALKFSKSYLNTLVEKQNLKIIYSGIHGLVTPNITPMFLVPFLRRLEKIFPLFLQYYIITIAEKE